MPGGVSAIPIPRFQTLRRGGWGWNTEDEEAFVSRLGWHVPVAHDERLPWEFWAHRYALLHLYRAGIMRRSVWVGMGRERVLAAISRELATLFQEQTSLISRHDLTIDCCVQAPGCMGRLSAGHLAVAGVCGACLYVAPPEDALIRMLLPRVMREQAGAADEVVIAGTPGAPTSYSICAPCAAEYRARSLRSSSRPDDHSRSHIDPGPVDPSAGPGARLRS